MKRLFNLLSVLLALNIVANAQNYQPFPTGAAIWEVLRCWYLYQPGWYDKYTFTMDGTDTLYDGQTFKKIWITNHHLPGTIHDTIYPKTFFGGLREADKKIYIYQIWASTDTTVQLVYDFNNTNIGDTIYTNVLSGNPNLFGHLITAVDSVLVGTNYHKRLHLQDLENSFNTEYWIEGVGSSWGLPFATFWSITDNSYDLSCFYKNNAFEYKNPSPVFGFCQAPHPEIICDSLSTSVTEQAPGNILFHLYPNPAFDIINLNINDLQDKSISLNIYNIAGTLVYSASIIENQNEIDISNLSNGIYMVILKSKNRIQSEKLIIHR